jgi:hypothetical protein
MTAELDEQARRLVRAVLAAEEFPGQRELLTQVDGLRVVGGPVTMLDLAVDGDFPRSPVDRNPVRNDVAWVYDEEGTPIGMLLVWTEDGYLSGLEYGWVTDEPPTTLPTVEQVRFDRT